MIKLKRLSKQPILLPKKENDWEAAAVFNRAVIYDNGLVHLIYRATNIAPNGKVGNMIINIRFGRVLKIRSDDYFLI